MYAFSIAPCISSRIDILGKTTTRFGKTQDKPRFLAFYSSDGLLHNDLPLLV